MYVDNLMLPADNVGILQRLANMCGNEEMYLGLNFITEKSGIMVLNEELSNNVA